LVALLIAEPKAAGLSSLRARFRRESTVDADEDSDAFWTRRRRVDLHPDDPVRPPIRAGRDLPAGGLGPLNAEVADQSAEADLWLDEFAEQNADELVLADLAPEDHAAGDEPWLQPAEMTAKSLSAASDNSLGAMVARLEAGLARRREPTAAADMTAPDGAAVEPELEVDFALEAALSTLQRMTRQSVG
ncbi:MAG: hypothetical protein KKB78_01570, partial [Alphaproteobacteria bacterium]|nr:hypothetical protein [Alphaproteobacteria bacterium]